MTARVLAHTLCGLLVGAFTCAAAQDVAPPAPAASGARAGDDDEAVLREAEKIQRSFVMLADRLRAATVSVVRFMKVEKDGKSVVVPGGMGSGVIVSRDGMIVTNVHVIENAERIEVVLDGGKRVDAQLVSQNTRYDFALLRVALSGLPAAEYARTANVEPGQWAIAAGNPRGLGLDGQPVVTLGIISGLGRIAAGQFDYQNALQTDAEINPGNSGGPLFDLNGRVIGINGKIATVNDNTVSVGVGFTIRADQIQSFAAAMASSEVVEPGYTGLEIDPVTAPGGGILVKAVTFNSPAWKIGLKPGDRITELNGKSIAVYNEWANAIALIPNGRTISVKFIRKDHTSVKRITLEAPERPQDGGRK